MGLLSGKTALITGASKGIGRAIAIKFAQEGARVAFTYLSSVEKAEALEHELLAYTQVEKGFGHANVSINAKGFKSDASDFKSAEDLINNVVAEFGSLDILVNNAGITRDNLLMRMSEGHWDEVINTNLKSYFNTLKAATRTMM